MSITELQVIQRVVPTTSSSSKKLFLPNEEDCKEDSGLVMKLDGGKVKDALSSSSGNGLTSQIPRTHVPTKLCSKGGSTLVNAGSTRRVPYFLQVALHSFTNIKTKVDTFTRKGMTEIPKVIFYISFLVLAIQLITLFALLVISIQPAGLWFLLGCMAILGYLFVHTAVIAQVDSSAHNNASKKLFLSESEKIN